MVWLKSRILPYFWLPYIRKQLYNRKIVTYCYEPYCTELTQRRHLSYGLCLLWFIRKQPAHVERNCTLFFFHNMKPSRYDTEWRNEQTYVATCTWKTGKIEQLKNGMCSTLALHIIVLFNIFCRFLTHSSDTSDKSYNSLFM